MVDRYKWRILLYHPFETMRQENTRENSRAVERRPGQILEGHDMTEGCHSIGPHSFNILHELI